MSPIEQDDVIRPIHVIGQIDSFAADKLEAYGRESTART